MIIVVDTNVIISGLIKSFSESSKIINLILSGKIKLAYDTWILKEYEEVLKRKKFNINSKYIESIIAQIKEEGIYITTIPLKESLSDKDDEPFLEVAFAGKIDVIITGNKKHFPHEICKNINVLSPSEFLNNYPLSI
ncbi:MAG: putative toxin-antitoxin system toxin component, PIN family [Actinobacteria bacterium]|nr:putative toxin-antitoxin system toxin component, PIN family [Actinomycetota bacterium]